MATWHPPIPAEAVYSEEVARLGSGLRLLLYCYNCVQRDGTLRLSLTQASDLSEPASGGQRHRCATSRD